MVKVHRPFPERAHVAELADALENPGDHILVTMAENGGIIATRAIGRDNAIIQRQGHSWAVSSVPQSDVMKAAGYTSIESYENAMHAAVLANGRAVQAEQHALHLQHELAEDHARLEEREAIIALFKDQNERFQQCAEALNNLANTLERNAETTVVWQSPPPRTR
jgi:hypothetical protein